MQLQMSVRYWIDINNGQLFCEQVWTADAEITLGFGAAPDFENSTGYFEVDTDTWTDVTDPAADPDHCDVAALVANDFDFMTPFTTPADGADPAAWGDFNQGGFMAAGVHEAIGTDYAQNGGLSAEELTTQYAEFALTYAGIIFWDATIAGSAAEGLSGAPLFDGDGDSGQYQPAMITYFNPETNVEADPASATGLIGEHGAGSTFLYNTGQ